MIKRQRRLDPAKEEEITRTQWARYERARDNGHLEYVHGWLKDVMNTTKVNSGTTMTTKAVLEQEGRPALTINTILPTINTILGENNPLVELIFSSNREAGGS